MVSKKVKKIRTKAEPTLKDVMGVLHTMDDRMKNLDVRLTVLERGQNQIKGTLADMQDDLSSALAAIDKDSLTLIDLERRVARLERAR